MADHVVNNVAQLNNALAAAVAGDNILVRSGYYRTTNAGSNARVNGGFTFANSGTSGNPITLKPYPGDAVPTLANRPLGSTSYFAFPTITFGANSYITVDGLKVDGAIFMYAADLGGYTVTGTSMTSGGQTGNIIRNCEIWEGWETIASGGDGNWSGIRVQGQTNALVRNNYIHDINDTGNCNNLSSMCGIKIFSGFDSIYEYNTIRRVVGYSQAACIDDKCDSFRNTHRFNWFEDVSTGPRIQNQSSGGGADPTTGTKFYQNVIILGNYNGRAFTQEDGAVDDYEFYNNTIVVQQGSIVPGSDDGIVYASAFADTSSGAKFYNNIFYSPTSYRNMSAYTAIFTGGLCDYNHYSDQFLTFRYGATLYAHLTAFQAVQDTHASSGDPVFTNLGTLNLTLAGGSPCLNTGKTGGTSGGSDVNKGAYLTGSEQIGYSASGVTDISASLTERIEVDDIGQGRAQIGAGAIRVRDTVTATLSGGGGNLAASLQERLKIVDAHDSWAQLGTDEYAKVRDQVAASLIPFVVPGGLNSINIELGLGGRVRDIMIAAGFTQGCWPLSELFATTFRDVSGNLNDAVYSGSGLTRGVPTGLPEQAMGITSDGNVVLTVADDGLSPGGISLAGGSIDIAGFIKTTTADGVERMLITNRNASSQGWYVGTIGGALRFWYKQTDNTILFNFARGSIADGNWHSFHCYYDPPSQEAWIEIDGAIAGLIVSTTNTDPEYIGVGVKILGGDPGGASNYIGSAAFLMIGREGNLTLGAQIQAARFWTNVATDVRTKDGLMIRYGSTGLRATDWVASTGTCTFVLDNSIGNSAQATGYYSPNHANCRQGFGLGIPVRVSFTYVTTTRYKFQGRIVSIAPDGGVLGQRGVRITATDWLDVAARSRYIGAQTQIDQLSTDVLKYLMDFADQSPGNVSFDYGSQVFGFALDQGRADRDTILSEMGRIAPSEMMYLYMRGNDTDGMTFVANTRFARSSDTTIDATFTDSMSGLELAVGTEGIINDVRATCYPPTVDAAATSVLFTLTANSTVVHPIPGNGRITIDAPYSDPNNRPVDIGGTAIVTPVATTHYTGNALPDGTSTDYTSSLTVVTIPFPSAMRIVITNASASTVYLTKLEIWGKGIYRYNLAPVIATDDESIQKYGSSQLDLDMPYQQSPVIAQNLATAVKDIYGQPTTRPVRMTLSSNRDDTLMTQSLIREIGDRIGIAESVSGLVAGTGYYIHEVDLECHGLHDLRTTWGLIPPWPAHLIVSYTGPTGASGILHDLDESPLELSIPGDYTFTFNRTGDSLNVKGAAGGGGGGGGESDNGANSGGGGGGGGGAINQTGVSVTIATTVYTGKVGAGGTGGAEDNAGATGGTTEFRVPAGTIHLQLPGGVGGGFGTGAAGGAGGAGAAAGTGTGNVAGTAGALGGFTAAGSNATNNATGAAGGGGGGSSTAGTQLNGGSGGNSVGSNGGAGGGAGASGTSSSGLGGAPGLPSSSNNGGGGGGGGGPLFVGGLRSGGGGGGGAGLDDGGAGGTGGGGALVITKV